MKNIFYFIIASVIILNQGFASNDFDISFANNQTGVGELTFNVNNYQISSVNIGGNDYSKVIFDASIFTNKKGYAELPYLSSAIALPDDKNIDIIVLESEFTEIRLDHPLLPSRGILYRNQDISKIPYTIDPSSVTDSWYPVNINGMSDPYIIKDIRGTTIFVYPFQYNAQMNKLRIYKNIKVQLVENSEPVTNPLVLNNHQILREMNAIYESVFINYYEVQENLTIGSFGDILVISTARDTASVKPLIDWKREKGFNVFTETVPTGTNVKNLIRQQYNLNNNILYVIIVGDWPDIKSDLGTSANAPMDPDLGCVAGSDPFPDITIGRISANSPADVTVQINKIINYEMNPDTSGNWLKTATGIASMEGLTNGDDGERDYEHQDVIWNNKLSPFTYDSYNPIYEPIVVLCSVVVMPFWPEY